MEQIILLLNNKKSATTIQFEDVVLWDIHHKVKFNTYLIGFDLKSGIKHKIRIREPYFDISADSEKLKDAIPIAIAF